MLRLFLSPCQDEVARLTRRQVESGAGRRRLRWRGWRGEICRRLRPADSKANPHIADAHVGRQINCSHWHLKDGVGRPVKGIDVAAAACWLVNERRVLACRGVGLPRAGRDGRDARERFERLSVRLFNVHPALTRECLRAALEDIPGVRVYLLDLNCHRAYRNMRSCLMVEVKFNWAGVAREERSLH